MNPLKKNQYELLERIGCKDAADKINELVRYTNDYGKITFTKPDDDDFHLTAVAIYQADTLFDAKLILKDYIKKIK